MHDLLIKLGLRFEDIADERRFVERFTFDDLGRTQAAMVLGAFVFSVFAVWDWIIDPATWIKTLSIRVGIAVFVLLPLTAALSIKGAQRWAELIYLAYCVIPGCALSAVYFLLAFGFDHASAGMIIIILFVSTLLPLRIYSLVAFCTITWICFAVCEALAAHTRPGLVFVNNFEIGASYALSLYAVGAREIQARRQFRTSQALRLEQQRLVQAEKLASLGQLVTGVAHEINTPLGLALTTSTVLDGDLKRLADTVASGQIRRSELTQGMARMSEGVRLLFSNVQRVADLVHSFKQLETDQASEDRRSFEMRGWVLDIMSTLQPLLHRKGHGVRILCEDGLVIDTYPGALAQVVRILALNAAVHAFRDGQTGILDLTMSRRGENRLRIVFADNGVGISPVNLRKIFDPFFTTRRDKGSTGLGLHIVFNLVVSTLRGQIDVVSELDMGTRFIIDLPLTPDPGEHPRPANI